MFHYVYCTENTINGRVYVGKHSSGSLDDDYLGSGRALRNAIKKHGRSAFKKHVLMVCESEAHALEVENIIVDDEFVADPNTYNLMRGGGFAERTCPVWSKRVGEAISVAKRQPGSKTQLLDMSGPNNPNYGKCGQQSATFGYRGSKSFVAKLTKEQVQEIITITSQDDRPSDKEVGRWFSVSKQTVMRIRNGTSSYVQEILEDCPSQV